MKLTMFTLLFILSIPLVYSQKTLSGKSEPTKLTLSPEYKRGLPPILFADMSFEDANNNNVLDADETAVLTVEIHNQGKGPAQSLLVSVRDSTIDPAFSISPDQTIPFIYPDQKVRLSFQVRAGRAIKTAQHKLEISIKEKFGYDMDPAYLYIKTYAFHEPQLVFSGLEIVDAGAGTTAISGDGKLQAGERVKVKVTVQNIGYNTAKNTRYRLRSPDPNIFLDDSTGSLGDLKSGQAAEFWFTLSPNKRVNPQGNLPVYLTMVNSLNCGNLTDFQLPVELDKKPSQPKIVQVNADLDYMNRTAARWVSSSDRIKTNLGPVIDISKVAPSSTKRLNAVAVVIGIEKYDYFAPAPYAENDAKTIGEYFRNVLGVDMVYVYKSKDATGFFFDNIFDPGSGDLQKAIEKGKTDLFVYYSGHGIPSKDGSRVYLLPADGRPDAIGRQGYEMNKLFENLLALGARNTVLFMDACFSGISRNSENYKPENLVAMKGGVVIKPSLEQPWESNGRFSLFSSSDVNQTSLGFDQSETGLFTYFLCLGLQGRADLNGDKKITNGELEEFVTSKVTEISVKISGLQTPQFHGDRSFVLAEF